MKMTRSRKLLSVVLALAICITTVFGCLMSVSAAEPYYTFGKGTVDAAANTATIDVTFAVPEFADGISGGEFTLQEVVAGDTNTTLTLTGAVSKTDGIDAFANADDFTSPELGVVVFEANDIEAQDGFASVKVTLNFNINGTVDESQEFKVAITSLDLSNKWGNVVSGSAGANGVISAGCEHIVTIDGASELVTTDNENGLKIYKNSICSLCGERFEYQVMPFGDVEAEIPDSRKSIYYSGTPASSIANTEGNTGADWDNAIIIHTAEELAYLTSVQDGKYYKIADDIKTIVLQKEENASAVMGITDGDNAYEVLSNLNGVVNWVSGNTFNAHFDGNNVAIYGLCFNGMDNWVTSALFPKVNANSTIKNIAIRNSLIHAYEKAALVAGHVEGGATFALENIEISNSCSICAHRGSERNGLMVGYMTDGNAITLTNCLVYGSKSYYLTNPKEEGYTGEPLPHNYLFGRVANFPETDTLRFQFDNCIILDMQTCNTGNVNRKENFVNYYTNVDPASFTSYDPPTATITVISPTDIIGAAATTACPNFAWVENGGIWAAGADGKYPDFYVAKEYTTLKDKSRVEYWNGDFTVPTDSDGDGIYEIDAASDIAYLASKTAADTYETYGKTYKVADDIKAFVMQPSSLGEIKDKTSAADVKAFFEANAASAKSWNVIGYQGKYPFQGTFDGNGATIYGMYSNSASGNYGGLFGLIDQGAVIKNVAVENSYFVTYNGMVGAIAGASASNNANWNATANAGDGTVTIENTIVANNYMTATDGTIRRIGAVTGPLENDGVAYNNNLVYGNDVTAGETKAGAFGYIANTRGVNQISNSIVLGCVPYTVTGVGNGEEPPTFTNVYTDTTNPRPEGIDLGWNSEAQYADKIFTITANDVKGEAAKTLALDWDNTWVTTADMPAFAIMVDPVSEYSVDTLNFVGLNLTYNDGGTFNVNFYFNAAAAGVTPDVYLTDASATSTVKKLTAKTAATLPAGVPEGSVVYSVDNVSITKIDQMLLPTVIVEGNGTKAFGKTESISIADYAKAVITGSNVHYGNGASSEDIQGDKNIAAAILNYRTSANGYMASDAQPNAEPSTKTKVLYWNGDFTVPTDSDGDGIYEIDAASDIAYLASKTAADTYETYGKTYKVADDIKAFVMQPSSLGEIKDKTSAADVKAFFEANAASAKSWNVIGYQGKYPFQGTFDGNGATIYGMYSNSASGNYGGLFGLIDQGAVIKNVAVENSYFVTYNGMVGAIAGASASNNANWNATANAGDGTVTIENTIVANNYMTATDGTIRRIGAVTGPLENDGVAYNNNLVYGNDVTAGETKAGAFGYIANTRGVNQISNSIVLGCVPYTVTGVGNGEEPPTFTNVYTDTTNPRPEGIDLGWNSEAQYADKIFTITADDAKGVNAVANCPELDWFGAWMYGYGDKYPTLNVLVEEVTKTRIEYWDGDGTITQPTETDSEGNIIIDNVANLAWLVNNGNYAAKTGSYKVADDIKAFVLQPESLAGIMDATSVEETMSFFETNKANAKAWAAKNSSQFAGTLDFGGAVIYGMYYDGDSDMGLFAHTHGGLTVKNVSFKNCYISTTAKAGLIAPYVQNLGNIEASNIVIKDSYVKCNNGQSGVIFGQFGATHTMKLENIVITDNRFDYSSGTNNNIPLYRNPAAAGSTVTNVIAVNVMPEYPGGYANATYSNVYSNAYDNTAHATGTNGMNLVTDLTTLQGETVLTTAAGFDWETFMPGVEGEYPDFRIETADDTAKTDSTIYWDGTVASGFTSTAAGTADDPIIINTAAELALMISQTEGKYYKIADGIKEIVLQKADNAAAVKAITDGDNALTVLSGLASPLTWNFVTADGTATFDGHFDGNGVAIYGLYRYSSTWNNCALFPGVTSTSTFKNFALRNSAVGSWAGAGLVIGTISGNTPLKIENVEVSNSNVTTFHLQANRAGILARGTNSACVVYENILVYGCKGYAQDPNGTDGAMTGLVSNNRLFGILNYDLKPDSETETSYNDFSNSIILGAFPGSNNGNPMNPQNFTNVYTDVDFDAFNTFMGTNHDYTGKLIAITATDAQGSAAKDNIPNFGWVENGGVWYTGNDFGGYPSFAKAGVMPNYTQNLFDDMTVTQIDSYGVSNDSFGVYGTTVNLKANPYIAFTFTFAGEYKDNRDNITVTFITASGKTVTTTVGNGAGGVSAGWTNNAGAGRYHLYRLKDVSVVDLASPITVTVNYNNTDYNFGAFSVEGFVLDLERAYAIDPCEYYQVRIDAAKALLFYIKMVNARFGA